MMKKESLVKTIRTQSAIIVLTAVILVLLYSEANIKYPLANPDKCDWSYFQYTIKTTLESGWFWDYNPRIGEGGSSVKSHSMGDFMQYGIVKLIGIFTDNFNLVANLFFFITFFLNAMVMGYVCIKINMTIRTSVIIAILFTFAPYHQMRIWHLMSTMLYLAVPLIIFVGLHIAEGDFLGGKKICLFKKEFDVKYLLFCIIVFITSLTDVIYSAFNCYVLAISILIMLVNRHYNKKQIIMATGLLGIEVVGTLLMYLPIVIDLVAGNFDGAVTYSARKPYEAQAYGLKIINLLLPRPDHRIQALGRIARESINNMGENENAYTSLGVIASLGFIFLLIEVFRKCNSNRYIRNLALMNIGMVLVATIGGVGAIVAYVIPAVRTYNRVSIYICAICLLFVGICLDKIAESVAFHRKSLEGFVYLSLVAVFICFGILDQTVNYTQSDQKEIIASCDDKQTFIKGIETRMSSGSKIYQLPYTSFPEAAYAHINGYLYSDKLNWSFGNIRNSSGDIWQKSISNLEMQSFLEQIVIEGYTGLYIDLSLWDMWDTSERDKYEVVRELINILGEEPEYNSFQNICFWNISQYANNYFKANTEQQIDKAKLVTIYYDKGFSYVFRDEKGLNTSWSDGTGEIILNNRSKYNKQVKISFFANAYASEPSDFEVNINNSHYKCMLSSDLEDVFIELECILTPGENKLKFYTSLEAKGNPEGIIDITFNVKDLHVDNISK